jgi:hypothetical protein
MPKEIEEAIEFFKLKEEYSRRGLDNDKYEKLEQMESKAHIYYELAIKALGK